MMLKNAMMIAMIAHKGQVDKANKPYLEHPVTVSKSLGCMSNEVSQSVALLHDVIEDTEITLNYLRIFFTDEVVNAVDAITHREDETYNQYIHRVEKNDVAKIVKIADLKHNLSRMEPLLPKQRKSLTDKYLKALEYLEG